MAHSTNWLQKARAGTDTPLSAESTGKKDLSWAVKDFVGRYHTGRIAHPLPVPGSALADEEARRAAAAGRVAAMHERVAAIERGFAEKSAMRARSARHHTAAVFDARAGSSIERVQRTLDTLQERHKSYERANEPRRAAPMPPTGTMRKPSLDPSLSGAAAALDAAGLAEREAAEFYKRVALGDVFMVRGRGRCHCCC